jgi:hypothetical protein
LSKDYLAGTMPEGFTLLTGGLQKDHRWRSSGA